MKLAKKSYGQHFLVQEGTAAEIANYVDHLEKNTNILEIGPGRGMLTKYLLNKNLNLKVVEADKDMVDYLDVNLKIPKDSIIFLDFLKLNLTKVFDEAPFIIIGNFPYNISSQIIFKMIESKELVPEMVGMFQREVAERIIASPGSKDYGIISVLTQAYYEGTMLLRLPPSAFDPPPKVNSAVIRLIRKNIKADYNEKLFKIIVKTCFNQRRKMLRNTLKSLVSEASILNDIFFNKRPEQISVLEFISLTNKLENHINNELRN